MLHEIIDALEVKILNETGVETVIHTDPILVGCEKVDDTRKVVKSIITQINPELDMHDFRMTDGENRINLIFDLEIPFSMTEEEKKSTLRQINDALKQKDPKFHSVIRVDYKQQY